MTTCTDIFNKLSDLSSNKNKETVITINSLYARKLILFICKSADDLQIVFFNFQF